MGIGKSCQGEIIFNPGYRVGGFLAVKIFPIFCGGTKTFREIVMEYKTILLGKFWMKSLIKD